MSDANTHSLSLNGLEQGHKGTKISDDKKNLVDVISLWIVEFIVRIKNHCKTKRQNFGYIDAVNSNEYHTERDKCFIDALNFLNTNPLRNNDFSKYVTVYIENGVKLNPKFFRNDLAKLEEYYAKADEAKAEGMKYNPFYKLAYRNYVVFMFLKLRGQYLATDDELFNVQVIDYREYNPLSKIPSVLRGELPFAVKEYDIRRAFPTFIDLELKTNYRETIYENIDKKTFATLLNANADNPKNNIKSLRNSLSMVYGADADKVLTVERFGTKGKVFLDFTRYEKEYVERFVAENNLINYVRLHDGIFVLQDTICENTKYDIVEFAIKECIKPPVENETVNFYEIDDEAKVKTSCAMYADFFMQEKIIRISTSDDKIQLLVNTNNVIDFFNHKTNIVSFLEKNINEYGFNFDAVRERIAKECNSLINQSFALLPPSELVYHSDTKTSFGLPFKNGFFGFDNLVDDGEIKQKEYADVEGYFSPHEIQTREFKNTDEAGMFEQFFIRASIGRKEANTQDTKNIVESFMSMFGYLCHNCKDATKNPCIVLTDMDADDETRNGRRGKTLILKAVQEVQESIIKGGREFDSGYTFMHADLEKKHRVYIIDDVPPNFKYDDLYTNILGDISCQRKGLKADLIKFKDAPKFVITSNWVVPYDEKNASTNGRFIEYKITNYYTTSHTPKDEFKCTFFQDWDADEWNRFYSFVFRSVKLYLQKGIIKTEYNKAGDNYKAYFNNDAVYSEFHRCVSNFVNDKTCNAFTVTDFLSVYNDTSNPLRFEKMFTTKNAKRFIDAWVGKFNTEQREFGFEYSTRTRNWVRKY